MHTVGKPTNSYQPSWQLRRLTLVEVVSWGAGFAVSLDSFGILGIGCAWLNPSRAARCGLRGRSARTPMPALDALAERSCRHRCGGNRPRLDIGVHQKL